MVWWQRVRAFVCVERCYMSWYPNSKSSVTQNSSEKRFPKSATSPALTVDHTLTHYTLRTKPWNKAKSVITIVVRYQRSTYLWAGPERTALCWGGQWAPRPKMGAPSPPRRKLIFAAPSLYIAPEAVQDREGLRCARDGTATPPLRVPSRVSCRAGGQPWSGGRRSGGELSSREGRTSRRARRRIRNVGVRC